MAALDLIRETTKQPKPNAWSSEPIPVKQAKISKNKSIVNAETQTEKQHDDLKLDEDLPDVFTAFLELLLREVKPTESEKIAIE